MSTSPGIDHTQFTMVLMHRPFPYKLYQMLEDLSSGQVAGEDAITWLSHGRAFVIMNKNLFLAELVPVYFHQTKLRSFYRQLNLWGFERVIGGRDRDAWHHPHFLRGRPSELTLIVRTAVKKSVIDLDKIRNNLKQPNFYEMPPVERDDDEEEEEEETPAGLLDVSRKVICSTAHQDIEIVSEIAEKSDMIGCLLHPISTNVYGPMSSTKPESSNVQMMNQAVAHSSVNIIKHPNISSGFSQGAHDPPHSSHADRRAPCDASHSVIQNGFVPYDLVASTNYMAEQQQANLRNGFVPFRPHAFLTEAVEQAFQLHLNRLKGDDQGLDNAVTFHSTMQMNRNIGFDVRVHISSPGNPLSNEIKDSSTGMGMGTVPWHATCPGLSMNAFPHQYLNPAQVQLPSNTPNLLQTSDEDHNGLQQSEQSLYCDDTNQSNRLDASNPPDDDEFIQFLSDILPVIM